MNGEPNMSYKASHGGKGSKPRPIKDQEQFKDNWDRIFGSKDKKDAKNSDSRTKLPRSKDQ